VQALLTTKRAQCCAGPLGLRSRDRRQNGAGPGRARPVRAATACSLHAAGTEPARSRPAEGIVHAEQEDGTLLSSPFHVRFGRFKESCSGQGRAVARCSSGRSFPPPPPTLPPTRPPTALVDVAGGAHRGALLFREVQPVAPEVAERPARQSPPSARLRRPKALGGGFGRRLLRTHLSM
jgi:hypothetical protein